MARTTVGKLASKTAAAAKRVTSSAAKKATAKKPPAKKATAKESEAKKAPAKASGTAVKKTTAPAKKAPATKAATKKAATKKATAKESATKKAPAKASKAAVKKTTAPAKKSASTTKAVAPKKATTKKAPAKKAATTKAPAKKATKKAPAKKTTKKAATKASKAVPSTKHASSLAVKADEDPWTPAELADVRAELTAEAERLRGELDLAERELDDLMRDAGDGAGNDQADVGSTTFERDHEMSIANNARDMLTQTEHALERIDDGTYGVCESCGQPIGKNRLMAFPRATLCLTCKQKEERR